MARRATQGPTEAELEILQVLWGRGPSTVREVFDELNRVRRTGYTTALKLLQIMSDKGLVKRDESRRSHVYEPVVAHEMVQRSAVSTLMDRLFDGSISQLVLYAVAAKQPSLEEIEIIRRILDKY